MEDAKNVAVLEGVVEHIVFHSEENSYTVFILKYESEAGEEEITCTGHLPGIVPGEDLCITGTWVNNPKYGLQLSVMQSEKKVPTSAAGIEKYLASGVIKGIGAGLAKRIVSSFGEHAFDVIAESPDKLAAIKGITPAKAQKISEIFHAQSDRRQVIMLLQDYGISPVYAMKIYKKYKAQTIDVVQNNPYKLAEDIDGIGFKIADDIAKRVGITYDSPFRVAAGLRYCLWETSSNGHVFMPKETLMIQAAQLLGAEHEVIDHALRQMQMNRLVYCEKSAALSVINEMADTSVFLSHFYHAELNVARKLFDLSKAVPDDQKMGLQQLAIRAAEAFEEETGLALSQEQQQAVVEAASNGILVITGGPGTGKTTTINAILHLLSSLKLKIELAAPTGRAAKRMTETSGREAKTLHRLLESTYIAEDSRRQSFQRNEDNPIETDVLIIDEASMVDIMLMQSVLKAISLGTRLIMVGDVDQLPSVGAGNVLKDIIASDCIKVLRLTEIFRQAQESAIVMNAHKINRGEYPTLNDKHKDFFFVKQPRTHDVITTLLDLVGKRLPAYTGGESTQDIQVLTPMRKSELGATQLNQALQQHLNPPSPKKKEREFRRTIFREGDKVMQIRNNYQMSWQILDDRGNRIDEGEGVFNGDGGTIKRINDDRELVTVLFDDNRQVDYDFSQLDELELAYAITVHKSQGSEYKTVVIPIHSGPPLLFSRNLLYTAVTRAKSLCVIVGIPETMFRMVDNNREVNRYTALAHRLRIVFGSR
ncbi:MAG: ATP-dependent RecD-like DNA helicase [Defluviitaleaceae bacterium]|nr:ATP-dependent RecD-like DNA helicase [Defluviitaleaceae bacterium]